MGGYDDRMIDSNLIRVVIQTGVSIIRSCQGVISLASGHLHDQHKTITRGI